MLRLSACAMFFGSRVGDVSAIYCLRLFPHHAGMEHCCRHRNFLGSHTRDRGRYGLHRKAEVALPASAWSALSWLVSSRDVLSMGVIGKPLPAAVFL